MNRPVEHEPECQRPDYALGVYHRVAGMVSFHGGGGLILEGGKGIGVMGSRS